MNRQQRRLLQRRGQDDATGGTDDVDDAADRLDDVEGAGAADGGGTATVTATRLTTAPPSHRVGPRQFLHEVNVEMRKVAWPTRAETLNYSTVVFLALAVIMAFIFGLDLAFSKAASFVFNP